MKLVKWVDSSDVAVLFAIRCQAWKQTHIEMIVTLSGSDLTVIFIFCKFQRQEFWGDRVESILLLHLERLEFMFHLRDSAVKIGVKMKATVTLRAIMWDMKNEMRNMT